MSVLYLQMNIVFATLTESRHIVLHDCSRNSRSEDNQEVIHCTDNAPNSPSWSSNKLL